MRIYAQFINGELVSRPGTGMIDVENPSSGEIMAQVPDGGAEDARAALEAARAAQDGWAALPAPARATALKKLAGGIRERRTELAAILAEEQAKTLPLAQVEVDFTAEYFDYYAGWARIYEGEIIQSDRPRENILLYRQPIGVVAGICPWNFPLFVTARKVAPAIVCADADLDLAAKAVTASRTIFSGQVCNCAERVYVHESIADAFAEKLVKAFEAVRLGDPFDEPAPDMCSQINAEQLAKIEGMVRRARADGAEAVMGGAPADRKKGYFYMPTLLRNCRQDMEIVRKEIFGPVLPMLTFSDFDEAIALANDCEYGLTSSIYTRNVSLALEAVNRLKFGETYVNRENFEGMQGFHAGWRKSGIGGADGKHGLMEYLQTHVAYIQY